MKHLSAAALSLSLRVSACGASTHNPDIKQNSHPQKHYEITPKIKDAQEPLIPSRISDMKTAVIICFLLVISLFSKHSLAQVACPPGWVPYSATSCGPEQGSNEGQRASAPPQWQTRWGAIVTDEPHGIVGSSKGQVTANDAEQAATRDCRMKGGSNCIVQVSFSNGCGALLVGDKTFNVNSGATEEVATEKAMSICKATDTGCHVYFTTCSPAAAVH